MPARGRKHMRISEYFRKLFKPAKKMSSGGSDPYTEAFRYKKTLPDSRNILVLAPHSDDETLGCGGAILLHKKAKASVSVAVLTDGSGVNVSAPDVKGLRRSEAEEAAKILGIDRQFFFDIPDMCLKDHLTSARKEVFELINRIQPDLVYAPSPLDFHPDHRSTFHIASEILRRGIPVAFYEIYAPVRFNLLLDISGVLDTKEQALIAYHISLLGVQSHFIDAMKGLSHYRGFHEVGGGTARSYEAFWLTETPLDKDEIIRWLTYDL